MLDSMLRQISHHISLAFVHVKKCIAVSQLQAEPVAFEGYAFRQVLCFPPESERVFLYP
ncbi:MULTISPECIES: hypothetical protein [unclassified Archaeoglobus]|uniref:hypothetical protein n=1 Tax=unclassified Archaeoglobus TaxID=2643606 RepID=UPI0025BD59A7|nr:MULTISPECIES: hypothetical protein [unclassified Archaeoglobus]